MMAIIVARRYYIHSLSMYVSFTYLWTALGNLCSTLTINIVPTE